MPDLPTGTVTFLFTDLAESTRLWEEFPDAMRTALARHDELLHQAIAAHGGSLVKMRGDGAHAAFATAPDAVAAAIDAQLALQRESWGETGPLRARIGLHTGTAQLRDGDYFGTEVNRAARLMAVAHGGQVVCSQATADLTRSVIDADCTLVDLGEQRLRDLQAPEHVFQVAHPDLPAEFPPLQTLDAFPGNLPLQVTEFVGRDAELADLGKLLERSRVVTLTGSGGVGKTRLAVQAAAAALPRYTDGAWFVDLASIDDDALVPSAIATAMGLPERRQGTREVALVAALGRRAALVVLDNCEHLVDAAADVVELIVHRCPSVTILATSQEGLGVEGEATFVVRPLSGNDAVRLFVERAEAARHGFTVSADNAAAVEELCLRLDGIPLAIELAAARVASMSPASILARVDERFRLLGHGRRTARRRHQTLRAAVDWSYGLLSGEEQLVFERLAAFAGPFTLDDAEAVVADDDVNGADVLDLVGGLVSKSMVQLDERPDADWYRLLETMRDYGLERLAERGDLERRQGRHARYYVEFADAAAPPVVGASDSATIDRLAEELPNLRAALTFLHDADLDAHIRLACSLGAFWTDGGFYREGLAWMTSALSAGNPEPSRDRAEHLATAGNLAIILDRYEEGFRLIDESLACSAAADALPSPNALRALSLAALVQNRSDDARRFAEEAIAVARESGDAYELAVTLAYASSPLGMSGDDAVGVAFADEGVEIARSLGNDTLYGMAVQGAAIIRSRIEPAAALALFEESFAMLRGFPRRFGFPRTWKAVAHVMLREYPAAARELCLGLPSLRETGEPYQLSIALAVAASVLSRPAPEVAVRLLSAIDQQRAEGRFIGAAEDLAVQAHLVDRLRERLDPDEFERQWSAGRSLSVDDAIAEALSALEPVAEAQEAASDPLQDAGGAE